MLRTWRGSAVEVFEASQLVSLPLSPGLDSIGSPKACPMEGKPAEPGSGFAAALVPVVTKGNSALPSYLQNWCREL